MVKYIKGVANLFMLYRLFNVWILLLMLELIRALRSEKKVKIATEEGCLYETVKFSYAHFYFPILIKWQNIAGFLQGFLVAQQFFRAFAKK